MIKHFAVHPYAPLCQPKNEASPAGVVCTNTLEYVSCPACWAIVDGIEQQVAEFKRTRDSGGQ
jgi:hypothetical protein